MPCVPSPGTHGIRTVWRAKGAKTASRCKNRPASRRHKSFNRKATSFGVWLTGPHKTGINIAASLHFVAALPNTHYFEYCVEQGALRQQLTRQRFPVIDGEIRVPEEPGLGVELDEAVVAKYRVG